MKIVLMEGEQEIWRMQAKKEPYLVFPINILAAILKLFSGIRVPGELLFTNKRIIFIYKKYVFCCIVQEEMLEYTMLSRVSSLSAGVKYTACFIKRDCITVNGGDDYFTKGMNMDEIQSHISNVMNAQG